MIDEPQTTDPTDWKMLPSGVRIADDEGIGAEPESPLPAEPVLPPATWGQRLILFAVTAVVLTLDQWSKNLIETNLQLGQVWAPIPALEPYFRIFHISNTGAAFGLLPSGGSLFAFMAIVVSGIILYYNHSLPHGQIPFRVVLGLLLGGGLGNLIDRFRLGHVTDFLDFGPWPVFNLADTSVVAGVCILAWFTWREYQHEQQTLQSIHAAKTDDSSHAVRSSEQPPTPTLDEWSTS